MLVHPRLRAENGPLKAHFHRPDGFPDSLFEGSPV